MLLVPATQRSPLGKVKVVDAAIIGAVDQKVKGESNAGDTRCVISLRQDLS